MKYDRLLAGFIAASISASGFSAFAQTTNGASDTAAPETTSLDPELRTRKRCFEHPGRPQWMIEQPLGYEWRLELGRDFRSVQVSRAVSKAETCDCDMLYPDWNMYRGELEEIWNEVSTESKYVWDDATRDRFNDAMDSMTEVSRPLLPMVTRLCAAVE